MMIRKSLFFLGLIAFPFFGLEGALIEKKQTICLNMIVKDEGEIIERCLESVKPLIDYWVIVDTGSSDGTQEKIRKLMQEIPGELHERPWVHFAHNRNEALKLTQGKGDYVLLIDADETLVCEKDYQLPKLDGDFYQILSVFPGGREQKRVQLINTQLSWRWKGPVNDFICCPEASTADLLTGIKNTVRMEGCRARDPDKFLKDVELFSKALESDPLNAYYVSQLAQTYQNAGKDYSALRTFEERVEMGGWQEEVFHALLQIGILHERLGFPEETIKNSYYQAYRYRPSRVEPLYRLVHYYRSQKNYMMSYLIADLGCSVPLSHDSYCVQSWMYEYGMLMEFSISAYWIGKYDECRDVSMFLLNHFDLPDAFHKCVKSNLTISLKKEVEKRGERALQEVQDMNLISFQGKQ